MAGEEQPGAETPSAEQVKEAYRKYRLSQSAYLNVLAQYVAAQPSENDPLLNEFTKDIDVLRVLHALSVGYGWSDAIYKVSTRAHVAQAQLRGLVTRDELHGGLALTGSGVELLRRWTDYLAPVAEKHARYQRLWQAVTNLEG